MEAPEAAVAVLHARHPVESILLIRRATNPADPWSGHWSFPGGHREPEDADLLETALRELREECAILLGREHLARSIEPSYAGRRLGATIAVAPFLFHLADQPPVLLNASEAAGHLWVPVALLADRSRHRWQTIPSLPDGGAAFPAIDLKGAPLWGFTYRVVCEVLGIEPPQQT